MNAVQDSLQFQRFEFKYILEDSVALEVRHFVRSYLELDKYSKRFPNSSYPIHSLYLDSPDLRLYHATVNGDKNRFKLRLRFYDDAAASPIFCEIKLRKDQTIFKQRGAMRRSAVEGFLAGRLPDPAELLLDGPEARVAIERFHHWMLELQAQPRVHVSYLREAWVNGHDNAARLTMDREIFAGMESGADFSCCNRDPVSVFGNKVILEIKFTDRFPDWFREMTEVLGLTKGSAAKYVDGVTRLGPHLVSRAFRPDHDALPAQQQQPAARGHTPTSGKSTPSSPAISGLYE